jgi:hypothetical protein
MELELEINSRGTHSVHWCSLQLQFGRAVVVEVWQGSVTRTGRAARRDLDCDCDLPQTELHSLIMSNFLQHIKFLISPSQDHSGDRALECWTSCVWCMHIMQRAPN